MARKWLDKHFKGLLWAMSGVFIITAVATLVFAGLSSVVGQREQRTAPFTTQIEQGFVAKNVPYRVEVVENYQLEAALKKAGNNHLTLISQDTFITWLTLSHAGPGSTHKTPAIIINKTFVGGEGLNLFTSDLTATRKNSPKHVYWTPIEDGNAIVTYEHVYEPPPVPYNMPNNLATIRFKSLKGDDLVFEYFAPSKIITHGFSFSMWAFGGTVVCFLILAVFLSPVTLKRRQTKTDFVPKA